MTHLRVFFVKAGMNIMPLEVSLLSNFNFVFSVLLTCLSLEHVRLWWHVIKPWDFVWKMWTFHLTLNRSWDSSVSIVTRLWPGDFLLSKASSLALGPTQHPLQRVLFALYLEVKQPGCEADQSLPCSAEIKNTWSCASTLPYAIMSYH